MNLKNKCYVLFAGAIFQSVAWHAQADATVSKNTLKKVQQIYGTQASQNVAKWNDLLLELAGQDIQEQLSKVNDFFNRQKFVDDIVHWNKEDYWATPIEFIASGGGDCEDFSIAKYFSMRALGVPASKLRLMYVKALEYNMAHMVLAYYEQPNVVPLVLDNINKNILPANQRGDLQPVYSFNGEGLWAAKEQGRGKQLQNGGNNSLWKDLTSRMNLEKNNEE
ncbi:transglutaminase-like cysteine peptidase [Paraglaciecola hydrolytica]|uniref:Transglutaminase n=1 Tax=Paraglaciecola hydrolytica TaxID=1799789 RepID=A0A136A1D1_9ALTE|nr:transglutaminase [Paraglaciecola hydrolytica]